MIKELTVTGSYFDAGYQIGNFGKKEIKQLFQKNRKIFENILNKKKSQIKRTWKFIQKKSPHLLEKLQGIAAGAKISSDHVFLRNFPEITGSHGGCTTVVIKNKKEFFIAHNEDENNSLTNDNFALIQFNLKNGLRYSSFVLMGELPNNTFSWNAAGIFCCVDATVPFAPNNLSYFPRYFEAALLIEQTSLENAVQFLKKGGNCSGFHYLLADTLNKKVVSVEKSGKTTSVKKLNNFFCHTNHHVHNKFSNKYTNKENFGTSKKRLAACENLLNKNDEQEQVIKILTTKLKRPFIGNDSSKTFATVVCDINRISIKIFSDDKSVILRQCGSLL